MSYIDEKTKVDRPVPAHHQDFILKLDGWPGGGDYRWVTAGKKPGCGSVLSGLSQLVGIFYLAGGYWPFAFGLSLLQARRCGAGDVECLGDCRCDYFYRADFFIRFVLWNLVAGIYYYRRSLYDDWPAVNVYQIAQLSSVNPLGVALRHQP